jgi:uncharacterized membrane protein YebE (DUF533 family)/uncharacterized membrane protein
MNELRPYCDEEKLRIAIDGRPIDAVSIDVVDNIANACIRNHTLKVTTTSVVAGLPGAFALLAAIPADVIQYYFHVFVLSQKLAYLYGYPDLCDENGKMTEETQGILTMFVGVMMGVDAANEGIKVLANALAGQVVKRLPKMALMKGTLYPLIKQIAKWIGIRVNKNIFAKAVGDFLPFIGGLISGGLTLATFLPSAYKLRKTLRENSALFVNKAPVNQEETFTPCEEVNDKDNIGKQLVIALINMAKIDFKIAPEEEEYIAKLIDESDLEDDDKMDLINILHTKEMTDVDLSAFKDNIQYSTALIANLVAVAKADNVVKPEERIYLFKIGKELGYDREDILDMLN